MILHQYGSLNCFFHKKNCHLMTHILTGVFDDTLNVVKTLAEISRSVINVGVHVTVVVSFVS